MPKRTRAHTETDTDSVSEFQDASDASDWEAAIQTRKVTSKRVRRSTKIVDTQGAVPPSAQAIHPTSWHVVSGVDAIRESLLHWYGQIHEVRGMPWRKPFDSSLDEDGRAQRAYEVWVSEIMLQQTQVATVIPYYNKWMAKFPTIQDLAASDIDTVNSLWKGLGYYSRAARLLSGAQKAVKVFDGRLPDNAKDMQAEIPGIGRYSAGAICSIAYNQCAPVLDGNVIRLLTRFLALYMPPKAKQAQDILWAGAEAFVENSSRPGDINQALIELGSTVCKVRDPACGDCPIQPWCRAYQRTQSDSNQDKQEADIEELCTLCEPPPADGPNMCPEVTIYPMKVQKKKAREELDCVNAIEWRTVDDRNRFFLLVRRPEGGLLAGLHEFPTVSNISGSTATVTKLSETLISLLKDLLVNPPLSLYSDSKPHGCPQSDSCDHRTDGTANQQMEIVHVKPAGDVVHVFSHIRKTYRVQWVLLKGGGCEPPKLRHNVGSTMDGKTKATRKGQLGKRSKVSENPNAGKEIKTADFARWVPLDQVEHANIGTGVMKVWKLVQTLW